MLRELEVSGHKVVAIARAVGGLGWTWYFLTERQEAVHNSGRLEASGEAALDAATTSAMQHLGGAAEQPKPR